MGIPSNIGPVAIFGLWEAAILNAAILGPLMASSS